MLRAAIPCSGSWTRAQIRPFSARFTSPNVGMSRAVSSGRFCTAAFRTSARTTSSVIRALCAKRSPNWSRAAGSGIRAATASMAVRNWRRPSSFVRSCASGGAVQQILQVRPRVFQQLQVRVPASFLNEAVGILASRQHRHIHLEPFRHQQLARSRRRALAGGVRIEAQESPST